MSTLFGTDARICPFCKRDHRGVKRGNVLPGSKDENGLLMRRRKCPSCGVHYKTYEINEFEFNVVKHVIMAIREMDILEVGSHAVAGDMDGRA